MTVAARARALALFDLDGTLIPGPSAEVQFVLHLLRRGRIGPASLARSAGFAVRHRARFGTDVWKKNKAYLTGLAVRQVEEWARDFVAGHLLPQLRPDLLARLREHRERGDDVVLLTGTCDFIAAPLCRHLLIPDCIATECATRSGRYLSLPPARHVFGAEKLRLADALAQARGATLAAAWAYADSIHDAPLLAAVGHAVAVHPDRALRTLALRSGWAVQPAGFTPT